MFELKLDIKEQSFLHELISANIIPMIKQPSVKLEFQDLLSLIRVWENTKETYEDKLIELSDEDFDSVKSFIQVFIAVVCNATVNDSYRTLMGFYETFVSNATHEEDKVVEEITATPLTNEFIGFSEDAALDIPEPKITIEPSNIDLKLDDLFEEETLDDDDDFFTTIKNKEDTFALIREQARKEAEKRLEAHRQSSDLPFNMKDGIIKDRLDTPWDFSFSDNVIN